MMAPSRAIETSRPMPRAWREMAAGEHFWFEWRWRALARLVAEVGLGAETARLALDIGCGEGQLARRVEADWGWVVDGVEIDPACRSAWSGRGRIIGDDLGQPDPAFRERYDVVFLLDVLEHLPNDGGAIRDALFHLKPGGLLLVNVPALQAFKGGYDEVVGHLRRYDRRALRALLTGPGLEVLALRYWGLSLLGPLVGRWLISPLLPSPEVVLSWGFSPRPGLGRLMAGLMRLELAWPGWPPLGSSLLAAAVKAGRS